MHDEVPNQFASPMEFTCITSSRAAQSQGMQLKMYMRNISIKARLFSCIGQARATVRQPPQANQDTEARPVSNIISWLLCVWLSVRLQVVEDKFWVTCTAELVIWSSFKTQERESM